MPSRLDAYATTLRTLNRVGLTGAHVMIGTPELLDDVRALEERGELTLRMVVPMHQEPAISDEEVERRLAVVGEHGRRWRAGTAKFFLDDPVEVDPDELPDVPVRLTVVDGEVVHDAV